MSPRGPATRPRAPWWLSLATLPARVGLALTLAVYRTPPSVGVLYRLSRWGRRDARGSRCGR